MSPQLRWPPAPPVPASLNYNAISKTFHPLMPRQRPGGVAKTLKLGRNKNTNIVIDTRGKNSNKYKMSFHSLYGSNPRPIERRLDWVFYKTEMKIWAVGCGLDWTVLKKVWADYEQLLREVISTFWEELFFLEKPVFLGLKIRL